MTRWFINSDCVCLPLQLPVIGKVNCFSRVCLSPHGIGCYKWGGRGVDTFSFRKMQMFITIYWKRHLSPHLCSACRRCHRRRSTDVQVWFWALLPWSTGPYIPAALLSGRTGALALLRPPHALTLLGLLLIYLNGRMQGLVRSHTCLWPVVLLIGMLYLCWLSTSIWRELMYF